MVNLYDAHERVPQASVPFYWQRNQSVENNVRAIRTEMLLHERFLPMRSSFDEAAVLVPDVHALEELSSHLRLADWEQFNQAEDLVHASPFGTRYTVQYRFFRHPAVRWRLEVMRLLGGFSPLHQALSPLSGGNYPVPHLSFKPMPLKGAEETPLQAYSRSLDFIRNQAGIHAQTCQSTYGVFSYWLPNTAIAQLYVKPRINTRDAS